MTNDTSTPIAPVYRYFVEDLLTGRKLAELDFRGVSYKLALNAAGDFSGSLIVKSVRNATDLYGATLPGLTALYVMRNGKAVWGGIIWEREYLPEDKKLVVSASEFTSYLHHRKIWKTWNHEYGGTVTYDATEGWRAILDYGSNVEIKPGSTVKLDFYEVENFKHSGYFRVAVDPAPTGDVFHIVGGSAVADLDVWENDGVRSIFYTKENHGFNTGDKIRVEVEWVDGVELPGPPTFIEGTITAPGGPNSNMFTLPSSAPPEKTTVIGLASRPLPQGTYEKVTIGVRQDTYDYVRSLIEGTFNDFVGTDFPNVYIEPGISRGLDIVSRESFGGYSILKTAGQHNIAVGQAVQIQDVGPAYDGEFEVVGIEEGESIVYVNGGNEVTTPVGVLNAVVATVAHSGGIATITTVAPHGMTAGYNVTVDAGIRYPEVSGTYQILDTPTTTTIRYLTGNSKNILPATLSDSTATVGASTHVVTSSQITGNVATLVTKDPHGFAVGNSVTVANANRTIKVIEKSLDGPNGIATIQTEGPHGLALSGQVVLNGLSDAVSVTDISSTTTSTRFTASAPHNLRVGDSVTISGQDNLVITSKQIVSNIATLATAVNHNIAPGTSITVQNLYDNYTASTYRVLNGVVTLTTSIDHNIKVNDEISVQALTDYYTVITKAADEGVITLTTSLPHNIYEGQKLKIQGLGLPFDGDVTAVTVTDQRVTYKMDSKYANTDTIKAARAGQKLNVPITVAEHRVNGTISALDSFVLGDWKVSAVTANTFSYVRGGNNYTHGIASTGKIRTLSVLNGTYTTTSAPTGTTLTFAKTAANSPIVAVPPALKADEIQAYIMLQSVYAGTRTVSSTNAKSFTVSMALAAPVTRSADLQVTKPSIFNGTRTVTGIPSADRFTFAMSGAYSMVELSQDNTGLALATGIFAGTHTITAVNADTNSFSYSRTYQDLPEQEIQNRGSASVNPLVVISTFGPYPGNANIGFEFPDNTYSGINIQPNMYRGFELKTVGEALDEYSNNINGFEYRIDVEYDPEEDSFHKKFILIPINFPNPPAEGEVSPLERFGAEKLVFEYPAGSVVSFSIRESAEEAATRFFALGENALGPDVGPYIGVASADELLRGDRDGRRWPLLDASDTVDGIDDKTVLHAYAKRFLSEMQPPFASFSLSLNGSRAPYVGTYKPGDWCSIVVNDPWMQMRLASDLEPRNDVIVRKIDSISVSVPDGVTYPEAVTVSLIAEWEVDKRGQ